MKRRPKVEITFSDWKTQAPDRIFPAQDRLVRKAVGVTRKLACDRLAGGNFLLMKYFSFRFLFI